MAIERTLSIVKPDAVGKNAIGAIYDRFDRVIANRFSTCASSLVRS